MNRAEHIKIHKELHESLDKLVADWIQHTGKLPSQSGMMELIGWSCKQMENPTETTPASGNGDEGDKSS